MAKQLDVKGLTEKQRRRCQTTISSNTFYMLVVDALVSKLSLSVVRMGDGEKRLYEFCENNDGIIGPGNSPFDEEWLKQMGCLGIPAKTLRQRIGFAANECQYFAPQIMGIQREEFDIQQLFTERWAPVDNWFVREWGRELQDKLLQAAKHVLFIHGSLRLSDAFVTRAEALGCRADCLHMENWEQAEIRITQAAVNEAPLVLFSGGPANKFIAPLIARDGCKPKVVIDLGQAAKEWT